MITQAVHTFLATHGRLLDRRRFDLLFEDGSRDGVLAALRGYQNPDGGFGWALEPGMRSPASQPAGALHAFEVLEEVAPVTSPLAVDACEWLASVTLPDGGLPFVVAGADTPGSSPWFASADTSRSSLHMTAAVCSHAHRVPDARIAGHPWLDRATDYCLRAIAALRERGGTLELKYALQLLDVVPGAEAELERLAGFVPRSGELPVQGGLADERLRPLDFSPLPGRPLRALFDPAAIERDLDRLAGAQREDGGWAVGFATFSPAEALEWRSYETVRALTILRANRPASVAG